MNPLKSNTRFVAQALAAPFIWAAALLIAIPAPAFANGTADQTVVYTFSMTDATYETGGGPPSLTGIGGITITPSSPFAVGSGTEGGTASVLLNGSAPLDPNEFSFGVGDVIDVFNTNDTVENLAIGTVAMMPSDSGSFQFLMDTEGGAAPTSIIDYTVIAGVSAVVVPEPATMTLLALGGLGLLRRRFRVLDNRRI